MDFNKDLMLCILTYCILGPPDPSQTNETKLTVYGLYKQATVGDNSEKAPWAVKVVAKAKWDAWMKQKGKSKNEAMAEYIVNVVKGMDV
mmetsp:Transcript_9133/g.10438  ORF Transcript_9133/g.10438 Transcript_9133/m.10438 type:complete len:89 (+) Transcript_9133:81-347(+)